MIVLNRKKRYLSFILLFFMAFAVGIYTINQLSETFHASAADPCEPINYCINFSKNTTNTVTGMPTNISQTIEEESHTFILPSNVPERAGYTFLGWSFDHSASTGEYSPGSSITLPYDDGGILSYCVTLYAIWDEDPTPPTYSCYLNFNKNTTDSVAQMPNNLSHTGTETNYTFTIPSNIPERAGYTFVGWNLSYSASTATYNPGDSYTMSCDSGGTGSNTVTLYAIWDPIVGPTYTCYLNYDKNTTDQVSLMPNNMWHTSTTTTHTFIIPDNIPEREGYTFLGWNKISTATTVTYNPGDSYTMSCDSGGSGSNTEILYAIWEANPTSNVCYLNYDKNTTDPVDLMPDNMSYSGTETSHTFVIPDNIPERTGFTFLGWDIDSGADEGAFGPGDSYAVPCGGGGEENTATLYAIWDPNAGPEEEPEDVDVPDTGGPSNQASENGSASMNNSGASSSPFIIASIVLVLLSGTVAARKYRGRIVNTHKERE